MGMRRIMDEDIKKTNWKKEREKIEEKGQRIKGQKIY